MNFEGRHLAGTQFYDTEYGIMSDTQYGTYYNTAYGDLYNTATGDNYNYNKNEYTYYSTTKTDTVNYSKYYQAPVTKTVYTPPVYKKVEKSNK